MEKQTNHDSTNGFDGLGIAPGILGVLKRNKFMDPTPIQRQAIPPGIEGKDLIGIAQTGTGKTLAFSIPMLMQLGKLKGMGLVLLPTRELALQVQETLDRVGSYAGLRTSLLIGGASMSMQVKSLKRKPHVIIATPGRLIDHLEQRKVSLSNVRVLVLDEADRMLDMGFAPQINKILREVPRERQTMLFSATMPEAISRIAATHMKLPVRIEVARAGETAKDVVQEMFIVPKADKPELLVELLRQYKGTVLVFSRTKHGANKISRRLNRDGFSSAEIHSDRSLNQRIKALDGFKKGVHRILVATDIAARGIDVKDIQLVVNYDLPDQAEDYVHRIGRTGRAGRSGKAISFATPEQKRDIRTIERLIGIQVPVAPLPKLPPAPKRDSEPDRIERPRRYGRPGGRSQGGPNRGGGRSSHRRSR